jgi:hypothetical protein
MAKTFGALTTKGNSTGTSVQTNNFTPQVGDLVIALTASRAATDPVRPTLTVVDSTEGVNGFTATPVQLRDFDLLAASNVRSMSLDAMLVTAIHGTGSGKLNVDFGVQSQVGIFCKVIYVRPSSPTGLLSVVQIGAGGRGTDASANEAVLTNALADAANAVVAGYLWQSDTATLTPGGSYALVGTESSSGNTQAFSVGIIAMDAGTITPSGTLSGTINHCGIAIEIQETEPVPEETESDHLFVYSRVPGVIGNLLAVSGTAGTWDDSTLTGGAGSATEALNTVLAAGQMNADMEQTLRSLLGL